MLSLDHILQFRAPFDQFAKRSLFGAWRLIEPEIRLVAAIFGDKAGIDGIGFRMAAAEFGIGAHACPMRTMAGEPKLACGLKHRRFVAARRLAHDKQGAIPKLFVAFLLAPQKAARGCGRVGRRQALA